MSGRERPRWPHWIVISNALSLALVLWFWRSPVPAVEPSTPAGEQLREERTVDTLIYRRRIDELEQELERVRAERRRIDRLLEDIRKLALAFAACLAIAFGFDTPAHASDSSPADETISAPAGTWSTVPPYRLTMDGRLCFRARDVATMLGSSAIVPELTLELRTLREDRGLAAQEIALLERLRETSEEQLSAALERESRWSDLERELVARVHELETERALAKRRRRRWAAVGAAAVGGVLLGAVVTR